ncbi:type III-A CRISPR-associated RAMP protein Csm4 [Methanosarcina acetivorans]|uniref:CRISPR system Cms protein Csm4 n=1 Tax=Methanosarcina acetivorans (strain ATCC 35395 / DSM 2834 / JCM 12185 / C2A) TaxID=188937 RepID=Q8TPH8_METAC|nr:type III-A CRISPR-associated RAMP protein Csm4 [Methanosarcina acetivorans]AAM05338.1 conserved hypothetical protein [Methanosarcina acetivorans C2A]
MIKTVKIVKLDFTSPLHIGEVGIGLEENSLVLHSDTIFNAICNSLAKLYGREWVTKFLQNFSENVPFRISSGFPFIKETLYFPKPMNQANIEENLLQDYSKKLKKTTYLTQKFFEKWIAEERLFKKDLNAITESKTTKSEDSEELSKTDINEIKDNKNTAVRGDIFSEFKKDLLLPKVSVSRENAESSIYFLGSIRFNEDSGIWFILDCDDEDCEKKVISALRLLQHDGIGGKRTWGYGNFSMEVKNIELKVPDSKTYLLLSLFYPKDDENENESGLFSSERARWGFSLRGGYAYPYGSKSSFHKPQRLFIKEGSIFEKAPKGKLIKDATNLDGLEKLYHYGLAYSIPISISGGENT